MLTHQKQRENILNLVIGEKNGIKCVRVWGMLGMGKTTIIWERFKIKEREQFEHWPTSTKNCEDWNLI